MTAQVSRWDDLGDTIPAGEAKYVVDGQPVAEYDNKHNSDVTIDIGVLFAFMNSYNANTILKADVDDTPVALAVGTQTVVGRLGGSISAIDIGIADNDIVQIDSPSINNAEYAKFTSFGLLSRSYAEVRSDLNVEAGAAADQTNNEIRDAVEAADDSNTFKDADHTKLNGIAAGAGVIPSGIILMWHGLIVNIPTGWVKCDGTNSTPDLRAQFVRGAPGTTEAGSTGGADTHTLTVAEMPSHGHPITSSSGTSGYPKAESYTNVGGGTLTQPTGGDAAHNNMPAYYEIIYIMKT